MIVDRLANAEQYYKLSPGIEKAFKYIQNTDLTDIKPGKYAIEDDKVFAVVSEYKTKSLKEGLWEAHRKYIDIQYIVSGKEKMGYCCSDCMKTIIEYDEKKDILFMDGQGDFLTIHEGEFALFTPKDAHMPSIEADDSQIVKKILVKILID
ncbi:NanQ anomerase/TabA/YiaL family protein [Clostridium sp. JNZ X4-2]